LRYERTVILSTHILSEIEQIAQRVLILRAGKIIVDETLKSLLNSNPFLKDKNIGSGLLQEKSELGIENDDKGFALSLEEVFISLHLQASKERDE
ncbi:MAG: hypothetical protein KAJ14_09480, partial [Candidatus Omnitrophica bacterium]|nr:hypothetical protein [Candidatus Omnitrophota bacterium]